MQKQSVKFNGLYCIGIAFAQALKASDASLEGKLCKNSQGSSPGDSGRHDSGNAGCDSTGSQGHGIASIYDSRATAPTWPHEKKNSPTANLGAKNVATNMVALTKDEKTIVAGHLANTVAGGEVARDG